MLPLTITSTPHQRTPRRSCATNWSTWRRPSTGTSRRSIRVQQGRLGDLVSVVGHAAHDRRNRAARHYDGAERSGGGRAHVLGGTAVPMLPLPYAGYRDRAQFDLIHPTGPRPEVGKSRGIVRWAVDSQWRFHRVSHPRPSL